MIIALEGIDACGKETQTQRLLSWAREKLGSTGFTFSFPNYETKTGRLIKRHLRHDWNFTGDLSVIDCGMVRQSLYLANKAEAAREISRAANLSASGPSTVILDRYILSGVAYGGTEGISTDWLWEIHKTLPQPDVHVLIDIDVEESFRRRPERGDFYESKKEFLASVRESYREEIRRIDNGIVVDGSGSEESVTLAIISAIWG